MAALIALPVGAGDAFYLETPERSGSVDGGRSIEQLPDIFRRTTMNHTGFGGGFNS